MAETFADSPAISVVRARLQRARPRSGELVQALRGLGIEGRPRDVLVSTTAGTARSLQRLAAERAPPPGHGAEPRRNFGEHNAVMADLPGRAAPMPSHGRRSGRIPGRGQRCSSTRPAATTSGLHYNSEKSTQPGATGEPFHNWCADRLIDKRRPLSLELPLHFRFPARAHVSSYEGRILCRWLIFQVPRMSARLQVDHCRATGALELHARRLLRLWLVSSISP